jgi:hypothetical protein
LIADRRRLAPCAGRRLPQPDRLDGAVVAVLGGEAIRWLSMDTSIVELSSDAFCVATASTQLAMSRQSPPP